MGQKSLKILAVEDGGIVGTTVAGSPNSFLCSGKEYADFELELETKTDPALNSGVQVHSHGYQQPVTVCTVHPVARSATTSNPPAALSSPPGSRMKYPARRSSKFKVKVAAPAGAAASRPPRDAAGSAAIV